MGATQRCEVVGPGLPRWSTVVDGEVGGDVVQVAGAGVAAAAGEDAVGIAQDAELAHRRGRVVPVHRSLLTKVEDGAEDHLAAGGGVPDEPVRDQLGGGGAEPLDRHRPSPGAGSVAVL